MVGEDVRSGLQERIKNRTEALSNPTILRSELRARIEAKKREFRPKKLVQAAQVGTASLGADIAEGAGIVGQVAFDAAQQTGPSTFSRVPRARFGTIGGGPLSLGDVEVEGESREDRVRRVLAERSGLPEQQSERRVQEAGASLANDIRQWAADIGYVPSEGIIAGTAEGVAGSLPHFGGGILATAGASAAGGPAAGLAVGAGYFGATEGFAHVAETKRKLVEQGVDEAEAARQATASGAVYALGSAGLEYVGLGRITRGTRIGKALERASAKPSLRAAALRTAGAAGAEGTTEVMQGVLGETLRGYATDDWSDFVETYTRSDAPLKEFLAGAVLGGGARGVGEITSPETVRSLKEWRAKSGVAEAGSEKASPERVRERLAERLGASSEAPAGVVTEGEAGPGTAAPVASPEVTVGRMIRANREVPGQERLEIAESQDLSNAEQEIVDRGDRLGLNVRFIEASDGMPVKRPGTFDAESRTVVIDRNAGDDQKRRALFVHEVMHAVENDDPELWTELDTALKELAPDLYNERVSHYADVYNAGVEPGQEASPERLAREGPSVVAEAAIDTIERLASDPESVTEKIRRNPRLGQRILDFIERIARRLGFSGAGIQDGLTRHERFVRDRDYASAAVLVSDTLREFQRRVDQRQNNPEGTPGGEGGAQNAPSAPADPLSPAAEPGGGVAVAAPPRVRRRTRGEFSNRDLRRRLRARAEDAGFEPGIDFDNPQELGELAGEAVFTFRDQIPTEVREALQGQPPAVRTLFQIARAGDRPYGEDALGQFGASGLVQLARKSALRGDAGLDEFVRQQGDAMAPDIEAIRTVRELRGETPARDLAAFEVLDNPAELEEGATFEIEGREFAAYTDENGVKRAVSEDGYDFNLDGVDSIPITEGSLREDAGVEVDTEIEVPFAVSPRGARTPYDTRAVRRARRRMHEILDRVGGQTTNINTPLRQAQRDQWVDELYGEGASRKEHEAVIVLGPPGGGKSSIAGPLGEQLGAMEIDSDLAKAMIPEYEGGVGAAVVHEESDEITFRVLERAIAEGDNMVLPRVGKNAEEIQILATLLNAAGYRTHLVMVDLPKEKAAQRVVARFGSQGRFVDPEYVLYQVGNKPRKTYSDIRREALFESYAAYSNDVEEGESPYLLEKSEGSPELGASDGRGRGSFLQENDPVDETQDRGNQRRGVSSDDNDVQFAVRDDTTGDDRGIFGQRQFRSQTGRQSALFETQNQSETQLDREERARQDDQDQRAGSDPDQGAMFAVAPDPEGRGTESGDAQDRPIGRPDLANPGSTEGARRLADDLDEVRNQRGEPRPRTDAEVEAEADARMQGTSTEELRRQLSAKVDRGEILDDVETVVAARVTNEQLATTLASGSTEGYKQAFQTFNTWRRSGTLAARAFRQRRDRFQSPEARYRDALMQALMVPDARVRKRIDELNRVLNDDSASGRKKRKASRELDVVFEQEAKRLRRVRTKLAREGMDPRLITQDSMQDPVFASRVVDTARRARTNTFDSLHWIWMNNILSGLVTHSVNITSNTAFFAGRLGVQEGVRAALGSARGAVGGDPDFTVSDWAHMWKHIGGSLSAGWTNAMRSFATNRLVFDEQITGQTTPMEQIKNEEVALPISGPSNRALRLLGLNGLPMRALMVEDQFFKTSAGYMHAYALAHAQARREGLRGDAKQERIDELLSPNHNLYGEELRDTDIWRDSLEQAREVVFQDDASPIGEMAKRLRSTPGIEPVARFLIPFINTPDRIFVRGLELSPAAFLVGLPYVAVTEGISAAKGQGVNARRIENAMVNSILALGLVAALAAWRDDEDGLPRITGTRAPNWRDLPEQYRTAPPMSIRLGDKWYSYRRIEPFASGLGLAIDFLDDVDQGEGAMDALLGSFESLLNLTKDATFLRTVGEVFELFNSPDRAPEVLTGIGTDTFVTAWVPNLAKQVVRAADPSIVDTRQARDAPLWERAAADAKYGAFPLSSFAPSPRYDIWGRPIERSAPVDGAALGFAYRLIAPIQVNDANLHPVDLMFIRYNQRVRDGLIDRPEETEGADRETFEAHLRPPSRSFTRQGEKIELGAADYQRYLRETGQEVSERLLSMNLNIEEPTPRDIERVAREFRRVRDRWKDRYARDRQSGDGGQD